MVIFTGPLAVAALVAYGVAWVAWHVVLAVGWTLYGIGLGVVRLAQIVKQHHASRVASRNYSDDAREPSWTPRPIRHDVVA